MKLTIKIFLPMLSEVIGANKLSLDFAGKTVKDLLNHLVKKYGKRAADTIFDRSGILDLEVQLLINHNTWVTRENIDHPLSDGDAVQIMVMMGGG